MGVQSWRLALGSKNVVRTDDFLRRAVELPRSTKRLISVCADTITMPLALWSALSLKAGRPVLSTADWPAYVAVVAVSLASVSYAVGLLLKSEDALAPLLNMVMVPLMLLSGIMLPMTLGPQWLQDAAKVTPFGYIITAMRDVFAGHYFNRVVAEGIAVSVGLAVLCVWLASRAFVKENA